MLLASCNTNLKVETKVNRRATKCTGCIVFCVVHGVYMYCAETHVR
jgi:hypothetical protein